MTRWLAATLILVAGAASTLAEDNPIVARMIAFAEAYNAADSEAIEGFYTEDGALLPPGAAIITGRAAIGQHYADAFQQGVSNLRFRILEIRQAGPQTAVEIGETRVRAGDRDILGRYLHVWALQDGTWMLSRDIYHVVGVAEPVE